MLSVYLVVLAASSLSAFGPQTAALPPLAFSPAASGITVASDVEYGTSGSSRLAMDVYKPATTPGAKAPAVVFFNRATGADRSGRFYAAWARAAASMVAARPEDARLRLAYGEALLGDGQAATACSEFDKLRDKGLGYRDLGLPAARACLEKGDPDAAIRWLRSIPPQYLPPSVGEQPAFAAIRNRPDFRALFTRR